MASDGRERSEQPLRQNLNPAVQSKIDYSAEGSFASSMLVRDNPRWFAAHTIFGKLDSRAAKLLYAPLILCPVYGFGGEAWRWSSVYEESSRAGRPVGSSFGWTALNLGSLALGWLLLVAFHVLREFVRPGDGALAKLSAGGALLRERQLRNLQRWRTFCIILACSTVFVGIVTVIQVFYPLFGGGHCEPTITPGIEKIYVIFERDVCLAQAPWYAMIGLIGAPWLLSLHFAAALATAAISDVRDRLSREDVIHFDDAQWHEQIKVPIYEVSRVTMPALSKWGSSVGACFVGCAALALGELPIAAYPGKGNVQFVACVVILCLAAMPVLVALVPAYVSSECNKMLNQLNELRPVGTGSTHARVLELEIYLTNANGGLRFGQGVGFLVFGTVLDIRALKRIAATSYAILVPAVTYMLHAPGLDSDQAGSGANL